MLRRFPGATILKARSSTPSANHPVSVPPTGPELCDALLCGRCTRWQALNVQTGSLCRCMVSLSTLRRPSGQLLRQRQSVAASMADCCGSSNSGLVDVPASLLLTVSICFHASLLTFESSESWVELVVSMLALQRLCIVVSVVDTSANERSNDRADNVLYDGSNDCRRSKLHACAHHIAHIWSFNSCYEWIHDERSLESGDDGVCSI